MYLRNDTIGNDTIGYDIKRKDRKRYDKLRCDNYYCQIKLEMSLASQQLHLKHHQGQIQAIERLLFLSYIIL